MKIVNVSASEVLNANILIVDEHDTNAIPLRRLLNNAGYRNVSFTDDFYGVVHLHRKFHYDLMLVNLQMPGIDEAEVAQGLQRIERESSLPVLVIIDKTADALRVLPAGTKDFIRKPFDMLEVKTRIHNMLVIRFLDRKIENINSALEYAIQERTAELKASEARFRSLVELSSDWYWEQDRHGNFTKTSGPVFEMLGFPKESPDQAQGCSVDRFDETEREQLGSHLSAKRPFIDYAYRLMQKDGSYRYLRVSGEPIFDETGCFAGYRGVGVDVSDHMEMEKKLASLPKTAVGDDAILIMSNSDMHLLDVNDTASQLWGYTREEFKALHFESIVCQGAAGPDNPEMQPALSHAATSQPESDTVLIKHKNGSSLWAEMSRRHSLRTGENNISVVFVHRI
jgi:PAS domain S-box-containing protein